MSPSKCPLVSVVIPTYGRSTLVSLAVESVLRQTFTNVECIVVDDCSPLPVEYRGSDPRVQVIRHQRNMGPGAARNTGLSHATGELITFLDDDDMLTPERVMLGVRSIGSNPMHAMQLERMLPDGRSEIASGMYSGDCRVKLLRDPAQLGQVLLRRSDCLQFDPSLRVAEDVEWWIRMADLGLFSWTEQVGVRYRCRAESPSQSAQLVRYQCRRAVLERHRRTLRRSRMTYGIHLARTASAALLAGRRATAGWYALRSLLTNPNARAVRLLVRSAAGVDSR
jgi:glycosyltransferase involved in cell wall biosynthesis